MDLHVGKEDHALRLFQQVQAPITPFAIDIPL